MTLPKTKQQEQHLHNSCSLIMFKSLLIRRQKQEEFNRVKIDYDHLDDEEMLNHEEYKSKSIITTASLLSTLPEEVIQVIREEFNELDVNKDGYITRLDIYAYHVNLYKKKDQFLKQNDMTLEELVEIQTEHWMNEIDTNKDQKISWSEWLWYQGGKVRQASLIQVENY